MIPSPNQITGPDHGGVVSMIERKSTAKARTNLGRYRSLERRYWNGQLTPEEEQHFEDLVYTLRSLYKGSTSNIEARINPSLEDRYDKDIDELMA